MNKAALTKLHEEVATYCAFYAELHPAPLLNKYPQKERVGATAVNRIKEYTS